MTILFPDIEKVLVSSLIDSLAGITDALAEEVRVGTIKTQPGLTQPAKEVVITASYNATSQAMIRSATATIEVFANDYETASSLALLIAALVCNAPGDSIKRAVVTLGPLRLAEASTQEARSMSVDLTVKGADL